jgi:hypothetical protein
VEPHRWPRSRIPDLTDDALEADLVTKGRPDRSSARSDPSAPHPSDQIGDDIVSTAITHTSEPTSPSITTSPNDPRALRLVSVLASGLPTDLGTPTEPALYTVPAVFSRQVTPQERARIEDPATARLLEEDTGAGPGLELAVSDRRLLIVNTTLGQLKDGLAAAIGEMLTRLGQDLLTEQDRRTAAAKVAQTGEIERLEAVAQAAAEIRFGPVDEEVETGRGQAAR